MTVTNTPTSSDTRPLLLNVTNAALTVTPDQFERLCIDNPDLRLELTADGTLIVMSPVGGESSEKNFDLALEVGIWNRQAGLGRAFDSSCGYDFTALGGGKMSPDVSWIEKSRLKDVEIVRFIPIVPDFLIELRSVTDNLFTLRKKMQEYQRLGVRLGLLVNPKKKQVEIYRSGQVVEILESPIEVDCDEVMPGFVLSLDRIW